MYWRFDLKIRKQLVKVPYGTPPKNLWICMFNNRVGFGLGLGLRLGLGLGNYTIFGWGCHKELFPSNSSLAHFL